MIDQTYVEKFKEISDVLKILLDENTDKATRDELAEIHIQDFAMSALDCITKMTVLTALIDSAYNERDILVSVLAKLFKKYSSVEEVDPQTVNYDPEFKYIVYIDLPGGNQFSWHLKNEEIELFDDIEKNKGTIWDGHTSNEKYDKLLSLFSDPAIVQYMVKMFVQEEPTKND